MAPRRGGIRETAQTRPGFRYASSGLLAGLPELQANPFDDSTPLQDIPGHWLLSLERMIPDFRDYAANERTYLAWVRTAITIMAFGFLVERFDLFLAYLARSTSNDATVAGAAAAATHHLHAAQVVGLALIALGIVIIIGATVRFLHHRRCIGSESRVGYGSALGDGLLALLLVCFAAFLAIYVYHQAVSIG